MLKILTEKITKTCLRKANADMFEQVGQYGADKEDKL